MATTSRVRASFVDDDLNFDYRRGGMDVDIDFINWVQGKGVPSGGLTNQILSKNSNADYDFQWRDSENQKNAYNYIKQVRDFLFEVQYSTENIDQQYCYNYFMTPLNSSDDEEIPAGSCTGVYYGGKALRHYDWYYDNEVEFLVRRPADKTANKYGSVGIATALPTLVKSLVESGEYNVKFKLVPFAMVDGINDQGLFIQTNVTPKKSGTIAITHSSATYKGKITYNMIPRIVLDNCATVAEISAELAKYDIDRSVRMPDEYDSHFLVADKTGGHAVIEFTDNGTSYTIKSYGTNAELLSNFNTSATGAIATGSFALDYYALSADNTHNAGLERWELAASEVTKATPNIESLRSQLMYTNLYKTSTTPTWYTEADGQATGLTPALAKAAHNGDTAAIAAFETVLAQYRTDYANKSRTPQTGHETWQTVHSIIYNLNNQLLNIVVQERTDDIINISLADDDNVKYSVQSLTSNQKLQARTNIGAGTYSKPANGITSADMSSEVQLSLGKADSALQSGSNISLLINDVDYADKAYVQAYHDNTKQDTLVAGQNIKNINGTSLLGSGSIDITSAEWGNISGTLSSQTDLQSALDAKQGTISDLDSIRAGATSGSTAVQSSGTLTAGHLAEFDSSGKVIDSGKTASSFIEAPTSGSVGQVLTKTATGQEWANPSRPQNEVVTFNVSSSDGQATIAGLQLSVTISGQATPTILTLDANGQATATIPVGAVYTVIYPIIAGYTHPKDANYAATNSTRSIYISYVKIDLANSTRSIVLEESSSPIWTLGGNADVVDNILGTYGSYVIDETNKKYARLNPANHAQFLDGTAWSGLYGNAFRRLPRVYFMVKTNSSNKSVLYISPEAGAVEDATKFWPETWIGTYKGSVQSGKLSSRPGLNTTQDMTISNFWAAAKALSPDYGLVNYFDHCMLNALALCKFGTADSPSYMGVGLQNAGNSYFTHTTGTTASLGDSTGSAPYLTTRYEMCKLFGIEDLAGSTWEFRPNIRFSGNTAIIYEGNVVSNDDPGIRSFSRNASLNGSYIINMALGPYFDLICTVGGGSASTYWCDGSWASSGGQLLFVGGDSDAGSFCGLSASLSANAFSYSHASIGARLAFRGDISDYDLVTGAQLAALH